MGTLVNTASSAPLASPGASGDLVELATEREALRMDAETARTDADAVVVNVRMVSAMVSQIHHGMESVGERTAQARVVADDALVQVEATDARIGHLAQLAGDVDGLVRGIARVASQTRMLAINATIEAAHAGELGRGFAVVAGEVKALARESAAAATSIQAQVAAMHAAAADASAAMVAARQRVAEIHDLIAAIAVAADEQRGLARTVAGVVDEAAATVEQIGQTLTQASARLDAALGRH